MVDPYQDGITHINIYSDGKTSLGRFLSNFTYSPFVCLDGKFNSIEGYIYWLGTGDERLRTSWGYKAKKLGQSLPRVNRLKTKDFRGKIKYALYSKLISNPDVLKELQALPDHMTLEHYYVFNDKPVYPNGWGWVIEFLESYRRNK